MMIKVFYDGKCGLCRREIEYYKSIQPPNVFEWIDITIDSSQLETMGVTYSDGLKLLHVLDSDNKLHIGVDAFIIIWRHINHFKILSIFVSLPIVRYFANYFYRVFATWRFSRLSHCQASMKTNNNIKEL
jgi:predicted DCC family thiol-disulfide oxidoreductase YuxK